MTASIDEVETLLVKSKRFMSMAAICVEQRLHDLACFNAQQTTQLFLKAFTLKKLGYIPRIHSLRQMIGTLAREMNAEELSAYVKTHVCPILFGI